ncbi:MAG: methyltransferase [Acidobacteriota bacterium]
MPRKELYEAWEVARRVRRLFRGGRVVDLAAGHGLLAQALLLLDDTSPLAVAVDRRIPASARKLQAEVTAAWPRLAGRVSFVSGDLDRVAILPTDVVVSVHACGALTDVVLERAVSAGARLAVLPCCHHHSSADARRFAGWMDGALAIDVARAQRLELAGYRVWTQTLPAEITPKGRLLLARRLI